MVEQSNIQAASDVVRRLWEKHGIQKPMRFLAFCLSLLPVPVIQQAGQALDRHLGDKAFANEMSELWEAISALNGNADKVTTLEEAVVEIAETVRDHENLLRRSEKFLASLQAVDSSFTLDTEHASYQEVVDSLIKAGQVLISARHRSVNVIENSKVQSRDTRLHASGGSSNFVDRTSFTSEQGGVEMHGISTQGNIRVSGSSVGFSEGSALIFGGNPNQVSGNCPICGGRIEVDKRKLVGYWQLQCPHCQRVLPFTVG